MYVFYTILNPIQGQSNQKYFKKRNSHVIYYIKILDTGETYAIRQNKTKRKSYTRNRMLC